MAPRRAEHRLEHFAAADGNEFPLQALWRLARDPASLPSPVILTGPPGSGKSHLLDGLAHALHGLHPQLEVERTNSQRLTKRQQRAQLERSLHLLEDDLAAADVLLIDDVHELAGRTITALLLARIIDRLRDAGRTVVLTLRTRIAEAGLTAELANRLAQGTGLELAPPSVEARRVLVDRALVEYGLALDPALAALVAERLTRPELVRPAVELLARLRRRTPLSRAHIEAALREMEAERARAEPPSLEHLSRTVEEHYALPEGSLLPRRGARRRAVARRVALLIAHELGTARRELADRFGLRPGSLDAALRLARRELSEDPEHARRTQRIRGALGL